MHLIPRGDMVKKKYAIIDIETTGGMAKRDRITEIGIVIHDGEKITDQYETLVNPGRSIPPNITRITGITNDMVAGAPKFFEVAKKVVEMTEGAIFVAHNVRFDYSFIKHAFDELGYTFTKKQLCTVRLTRKAFPGLRSYSLGNLIKHFGIHVDARHRALDDAKATAIILDKILKHEENYEHINHLINEGIKESRLPRNITVDFIQGLPEKCGVYYFYNEYGTPVYIGKSINIKKRIMQHFSKTTKKSENLQKSVNSISFEITGSELASLLHESNEIKKFRPEINKAQRTREYPYFIHQFYDHDGYVRYEIKKTSKKNEQNKDILGYYGSLRSAKSQINNMVVELELCEFKAGLMKEEEGPCYSYKLHRCKGACLHEEVSGSYNERASMARPFLQKRFERDFILIDKGRTDDEKSVFLVQDQHFQGYGYITTEDIVYGAEELMEAVKYMKPNPELNGIVRNYLLDEKYEKLIEL